MVDADQLMTVSSVLHHNVKCVTSFVLLYRHYFRYRKKGGNEVDKKLHKGIFSREIKIIRNCK